MRPGLLAALIVSHIATQGPLADEAPPPSPVHVEKVTVTATRLHDDADEIERTPAHVTVLTREQIESSGARNLQDLLALEAGVVLYDGVGNDIQKTLDLRGFTDGSGTKVFLNGAPVNDPRSNALALELIPIDAVERIEITRGSTAALAGGGSEAGVIRIRTSRGEGPGGSLSVALGSFDTAEYAGRLTHAAGLLDLFISASREKTDGFRANGGGDLDRLAGGLGFELGDGRRVELDVIDGDSDLGSPGALTAAELAANPFDAPFNSLDFAREGLTQAALNFRGPVTPRLSLAANVARTERSSEILTTGRAAPSFGGFFLGTDAADWSSTAQITYRHGPDARSGRLVTGVEWLEGETDAIGISTPTTDPGLVDPANLASDNTTLRRAWALFAQETWYPTTRLSLHAGVRVDRDRSAYRERVAGPAGEPTRSFSEASLRAGVTWKVASRYTLRASYGEAFLPPTVEQLFAFPLFGSNPDLRPEDSRSYETGLHAAWGDDRKLDVALFVVDTRDEIVFDPASPLGLFGANVNAGQTRRRGVESTFTTGLGSRLDLFATLTLMDAEFLNGANRGNDVPLVPGHRLTAGFDLDLAAGLHLRLDALTVGRQVLDNDGGNTQPELDAYGLVNARVSWSRGEGGRWVLFAEARNLFDEEYATRGIYAFDFQAGVNETFLTPGPGRRYLTGAEWTF